MKLITNNFGLKLLSLLLASILSAYVISEVNYPVPGTLNLPLQVRGTPKDLVIVSTVPPSVALRVRGPYRLIRRLEATGPPVSLDLRRYTLPGDYDVRVEVPDLGRVLVTGQQYETYKVTLDRRAALKKALGIDPHGDLGERLMIGEEKVEPVEVLITGPASLVQRVVIARIEPDLTRLGKRIGGKLQPVAEMLPIRLYDADGHELTEQLIRKDPETANYALTPAPVGSIRVLKVLPKYVGEAAEGFFVSGLSPSVLYVPLDAELVPEQVTSVHTTPIDISGRSATFTANARLVYDFKLPADSGAPTSCDVTVEILSRSDANDGLYELKLALDGRISELNYDLDPASVDLVMEAGQAKLSEPQLLSIKASISVAGLGPGEYWLMPQLSLPAGVKGARILPSTVHLTVNADGSGE